MVVKLCLRILILGLVAYLIEPVSNQSYADDVYSIQAMKFRDRYIRHKNFTTYLDPITDEQTAKDATFHLISGLGDGTCYTFEARYLRGYYLRHWQFRLVLAQFDSNDPNFRADATFCPRKGLVTRAGEHLYSFESLNYRGYYIRHRNFELWVNKNDGSDGFRLDATFLLSPPVHAPGTFDPGTNQIPSTE